MTFARSLLPALLLVASLGAPGELAAADGPELPGLDGGRLGSAELERGAVIVVFWASWSPRCRDVVPRLGELARSWSSKARVVSVVFQEEPAAVRRFLAGKSPAVPVYLDRDGSFAKKHAIATLPGLLILKNGEAVYRGKLPVSPDPVIERALAQ